MDDCTEFVLKKLCCTCLNQDRKLKQLCRLPDGVNNLYLLLSYDSEAYREGFFKDTGHWFICWECWAVMCRITRFRSQACEAQKRLADLVVGRTEMKLFKLCLSRLTLALKVQEHSYDPAEEVYQDPIADNFIDCGPAIKSESEDDMPLSELHSNMEDDRHSEDDTTLQDIRKEKTADIIKPIHKKRQKVTSKKKKKDRTANKKDFNVNRSKEQFTTTEMTEDEMKECRERRKMTAKYADAKFQCESCVEGFKSQIDWDSHNVELHTQKEDRLQCDICLSYTPVDVLPDHRSAHYRRYQCSLCEAVMFSLKDITSHLATYHAGKNGKKGVRKTQVANPGSKPRRSRAMMDKRTPYGYKCAECDKYFDNKNLRWKHVQRSHREGYSCTSCGKTFAFRNNLTRHELSHQGPPPRQECPHCHKQVRVDLFKAHQRTHGQRAQYACAECDKRFASKASYEHHLNYTSRHALTPPNRHKCTLCEKAYRSRGELRDHTNYQHLGKTQHKCPICDKGLATPRCVTRHVRRAHHGIKEQARDKICQKCGKAFRDKKTVREHELTHTGERPLACGVCGGTFRQRASLYAHARRVHRAGDQ